MTISFFPQFRRMKSYGADGVAMGRQGGEARGSGGQGSQQAFPGGHPPSFGGTNGQQCLPGTLSLPLWRAPGPQSWSGFTT